MKKQAATVEQKNPDKQTPAQTTTITRLLADEKVRKRLAKYVALHCFRNSGLEDHHSGITPSSQAGDYSDVKVVTPYGEIPWKHQGE